jgi:hypothetical protein
MVALLVRYYRLSEESARELIVEMQDTRSLENSRGLSRGASGASDRAADKSLNVLPG